MGRIYDIGDLKLPSVTTVLGDYDKVGLMHWVHKVATEGVMVDGELCYDYKIISERALTLGTAVHDLIEKYIKIDLNPNHCGTMFIESEFNPYIEAFIKWVEDNNVIFLESEQTVHNKVYGYAGTLDLLCEIDGKLYIVDFKVSNGHYLTNSLQITAYKKAWEEREIEKAIDYNTYTPREIEGVGVLRLGKDNEMGTYDWKDYTSRSDDHWECFKGLLIAWYTYKNRRGVSK